MPMELILSNADLNLPQSIANLEQLKEELIPKLEKYNNLIVTEDSIKAAKDDKAALNKLKKAIEEQRISIKKQYLEPYNVLEAQCKEVVKLIDEPIQAIDKQVKAFEEIEKKEKYNALAEAYNALNAPEWLKIEDVLNPKWENKTQKLEALKAEMAECCKKHIEELDKLMEMYKDFPHKVAIMEKYKNSKDFSSTAVYAVSLEQEYKRELARKAEEEEKRKAEEAKRAETEPVSSCNVNNDISPAQSENAVSVENKQSEPMITGTFKVTGTKTQIVALRNFMKAQDIKYEIVK
jgi:hypothetical protein